MRHLARAIAPPPAAELTVVLDDEARAVSQRYTWRSLADQAAFEQCAATALGPCFTAVEPVGRPLIPPPIRWGLIGFGVANLAKSLPVWVPVVGVAALLVLRAKTDV